MRLDDGTIVIVDAGAELKLTGQKISLAKGRLFLQAGAASRTEVVMRDTTATVVSSAAAFDAGADGKPSSVYCARGEINLSTGGKASHVASEIRHARGRKVAPENRVR